MSSVQPVAETFTPVVGAFETVGWTDEVPPDEVVFTNTDPEGVVVLFVVDLHELFGQAHEDIVEALFSPAFSDKPSGGWFRFAEADARRGIAYRVSTNAIPYTVNGGDARAINYLKKFALDFSEPETLYPGQSFKVDNRRQVVGFSHALTIERTPLFLEHV